MRKYRHRTREERNESPQTVVNRSLYNKARWRALHDLARLHEEEFAELLVQECRRLGRSAPRPIRKSPLTADEELLRMYGV